MASATLTNDGKIKIPPEILASLGIGEGDRIEFVEIDGVFVIIPANRSIKEIKGAISKPASPVSISEMNPAK